MKSWILLPIILLMTANLNGITGSDGKAHYRAATVCAVLSNPNAYLQTYVGIDADVVTDGMHGTILTDKNCPNRGLLLDYPRHNADHSVADFETAITNRTTMGKSVSGTFIGKVTWDKADKRINYSLLSVKNLRIGIQPESH
jgi:hypothetical protein